MLHLLLSLSVLSPEGSPARAADSPRPELAVADSAACEHEIQLGLREYRRLRLRAAERHFEAAVEADPADAAAWYYLGYTVYKTAEPKPPDDPGKHRALTLFTRAFALEPSFVPTWR